MTGTENELKAALTTFFENENDRIFQAAMRLNQSNSAGATRAYTEVETMQMVRAFRTMLLEELRGEQTETRSYLLEVLMPGFVAQGDPVYNIVQWNTTFMTLLAGELTPHMPEALRSPAAYWFAHYTGVYVADVARVANEAASQKRQSDAE
jgi:hypothetical protein